MGHIPLGGGRVAVGAQAISQGGASPASYSNLAAIEIQAGEIASAAELLKQALVLSPNSAESWLNLGTVEFALGR